MRNDLFILPAVAPVSQIVGTVTHVPRYYIVRQVTAGRWWRETPSCKNWKASWSTVKSQISDGSDSLNISALTASQRACKTNRILEKAGDVVILFLFSRKHIRSHHYGTHKPVQLMFSASGGYLTSYCQVLISLLMSFATEDIIAEADLDIMDFKEPAIQDAVKFLWTLCRGALRYKLAY